MDEAHDTDSTEHANWKAAATEAADPHQLLREHQYPDRVPIGDLEFETWKAELNPKFCKDGYIYLLRGDHPGLDAKGLYSRPYGYGKLNTKQLTGQFTDPQDLAYFLFNDDRYLNWKPSSTSSAQQLAFIQSAIGASSFISATTNLPCAEAGTDNQPDPEVQAQYEIYILKIPAEYVINRNGNDLFGLDEEEYLIPDYIRKDEIIAKFPRSQREQICEYMNQLLGVTKADLGVVDEQ